MACPPTFQPFSADDENPNSFNPGINALENEGAYRSFRIMGEDDTLTAPKRAPPRDFVGTKCEHLRRF
jgi:hypothetical protein